MAGRNKNTTGCQGAPPERNASRLPAVMSNMLTPFKKRALILSPLLLRTAQHALEPQSQQLLGFQQLLND
jgi:hypothetical protein